jgi:hypothetical protein
MKRKSKTNSKNQEDKQSKSGFAKYRGVGLGQVKTKAQMDDWLKDLRGRDE